jgi:hypothetical protein
MSAAGETAVNEATARTIPAVRLRRFMVVIVSRYTAASSGNNTAPQRYRRDTARYEPGGIMV